MQLNRIISIVSFFFFSLLFLLSSHSVLAADVTYNGSKFDPTDISINKDESITWKNTSDAAIHIKSKSNNATDMDVTVASGSGTGSYKFTNIGTFAYYIDNGQNIIGTVTVNNPSPTATPTPSPTVVPTSTPTTTPVPAATTSPTRIPSRVPSPSPEAMMHTMSAQQTGSVQGAATPTSYNLKFTVVDSKQKPVHGVIIATLIAGREIKAATDTNGKATIANIPPGERIITAAYKDQKLEETINATGDKPDIDLTLEISGSNNLLATVVIFGLAAAIIGSVIWVQLKKNKNVLSGSIVELKPVPSLQPSLDMHTNSQSMNYTPLPEEMITNLHQSEDMEL